MPGGRPVPADRAARDPPGEAARREHRRRQSGRSAAPLRLHRPRQARRARPPPRGRPAPGRRAPRRDARLADVAGGLLGEASGRGPQDACRDLVALATSRSRPIRCSSTSAAARGTDPGPLRGGRGRLQRGRRRRQPLHDHLRRGRGAQALRLRAARRRHARPRASTSARWRCSAATRAARPRAQLTALDVLVLPAGDFSALAGGLPEFRRGFEEIARRRAEDNAGRCLSRRRCAALAAAGSAASAGRRSATRSGSRAL